MLVTMDGEAYLDAVGELVEPGGRPPAPGTLRLLQQYVNTYNHELPSDRDRLGTPELATSWLRDHGLLGGDNSVYPAEVAGLHALREAVRSLAAANRKSLPSRPVIAELETAARRTPLFLTFDDAGSPRLEPQARGGYEAVGRILVILYGAMSEGTWPRLKACRQCGWLFYDRSKNRSSQWCAMSVCGNRAKNRSYRDRLAKI